MRFVNPQNDIAFKKIFGNEQCKDVLIAFLNAVLDLAGRRAIETVELLSPFEAPKVEELKQTILDVKARDGQGKQFIVEMQVSGYPSLKKRFQYYAAKTYTNQIAVGEEYPKLNQVIFIGILNFSEFDGPAWLTRHLLLNSETGKQELQDLEFNFIELPKFTKSEAELETAIDKWVWFIKYAPDLEVIPNHAESEPALRHAYETADRHGWTVDEWELYESCAMRRRGERDLLELTRLQGIQQGRQEGRQEGESALLRRQLIRRFGTLPETINARLATANSEQLAIWGDRVLEATSLDDIFE
ncbi:MAG: Rpn family recombination-promoting nuclease/putative transposase [Gammaproteobacteria bacterium]|nr:Rpn family recombination-promoting nuclease/putative transposase [Gammaproteobacteria bacterium]